MFGRYIPYSSISLSTVAARKPIIELRKKLKKFDLEE
jgi:hypothetical protein